MYIIAHYDNVTAHHNGGKSWLALLLTIYLSWSMLGHVLSEEQSKVGSDGVSDDGRLTIVQCHHYHRPPSSDLYWSSIGILPLLRYHKPNLHSNHCHYQPTPCAIYCSTTTAPPCSTPFHIPGQSHRARTSLKVMSRSHHKDLWGFTSASFGTIQNTSLLVICSFYYHMLFTLTPYMFMFCLYINTPICCMYFASLNINLATYFSLTHSHLLKLLLGSTPDSPTPSGPPKFKASIKRAAQPTSWSQCLARLRTRHLRPNSELNTISLCQQAIVRSTDDFITMLL